MMLLKLIIHASAPGIEINSVEMEEERIKLHSVSTLGKSLPTSGTFSFIFSIDVSSGIVC